MQKHLFLHTVDAPLVTSVTDMSILLKSIVSDASPFSQVVASNMHGDAYLTGYR